MYYVYCFSTNMYVYVCVYIYIHTGLQKAELAKVSSFFVQCAQC